MSGPLRGAGIVITRPARQAALLAQQIAAVGGTPLIFPTIAILPPGDTGTLDDVHRRLAQFDYAIFVSANAAEFGVGDPRAWPATLPAFAPGPGTASALAAAGIGDVRQPQTTMDSEGLLALDEFADPAGKRVVIFRGGAGRDVLADTLTERGAHVTRVDCYRRARPQTGAEGLIAAWRERRVDAITLTSSEGLDNLWEMLDSYGRTALGATPAFVSHPRIAERAHALKLARVIVAAPTDAGLIAALLQYFDTDS
ncbi:MAG TPA: uroporphyrinogen-III synthase [Casimicrobiaceae bacterium]|jgi:uroporphyrinogen-III synthase|nr:uroporphyrinogen-III synthase [Casimicrobiaceae bacterium]